MQCRVGWRFISSDDYDDTRSALSVDRLLVAKKPEGSTAIELIVLSYLQNVKH